MIYLFLFIVILFLMYVSFFTSEKREKRAIRRTQKIFNSSLNSQAVEFVEGDERNTLYPDEIVKLGLRYMTRKEASSKFFETRKKYPNLNEEDIQKIALL